MDGVVVDGEPAAVLVGLQVAADGVARAAQVPVVGLHLQVAVDPVGLDGRRPALHQLHAAAHLAAGDDDLCGAFGLDVAVDVHTGRPQGAAGAHDDVALDGGPVEDAGRAVGDDDVVMRLRPDRCGARRVVGSRGSGHAPCEQGQRDDDGGGEAGEEGRSRHGTGHSPGAVGANSG